MIKGDVILKKIDANNYQLFENITYTNSYYEINVLKGFKTDGASIPRFLWSLIGAPFNGDYTFAAIIHDALYKSEYLDRSIADKLFLDMMKELNVSFSKRYTMFLAVKSFGWLVWKKHIKEDVLYSKKFIKIIGE